MTGQEALNKFVNSFAEYYVISQHQYLNATNMQTAVEYLARSKECRTIEKSLKALEIIKEKNVSILDLRECISREFMGNIPNALEYYNEEYTLNEGMKLTEEEYELLKEVLE
jgi:hypothetical protein